MSKAQSLLGELQQGCDDDNLLNNLKANDKKGEIKSFDELA